jgi:hypothetical protein
MVERLILTGGTRGNPLADRCWKTQADYAAKVGAEFRQIDLAKGRDYLPRLLGVASKLLPETRVLWLEWDVEISPGSHDVFEIASGDAFHLRPHPMPMKAALGFYNIGVMLGKSCHFAAIEVPSIIGDDPAQWEPQFCRALKAANIPVSALDQRFNAIPPETGDFIHLAGPFNQ